MENWGTKRTGDENMKSSIANDIHVFGNDNIGVLYYIPTNSFCSMPAENVDKIRCMMKEDPDKVKDIVLQNFSDEPILNFSDSSEKTRHLKKLEIIIQTGCNLACKYCYANAGTYNQKREVMDENMLEEYLMALIPENFDDIDFVLFFGGEPAQYPNIITKAINVLRGFVDKGWLKRIPIFGMITNGTFYTPALSNLIKNNHILTTISIDGPKNVNDQLRIFPENGESTYQLVSENIDKFCDDGIDWLAIEATYTTKHIEMGYSKNDVRKYISKRFPQVFEVIVGDCTGDSIYSIDDEQVYLNRIKLFDLAFQNIGLGDFSFNSLIRNELKAVLNPNLYLTKCSAGIDTFCLFPQGNLKPCHLLSDDCFTSALYDSNNKAWDFKQSEKVLEFLLNHGKTKKRCETCWARFICASCPSLELNSNLNQINQHCDYRLSFYEHIILKLAEISEDKDLWSRLLDSIELFNNNYSC